MSFSSFEKLTSRGGKGAWVPPSEFPAGGEAASTAEDGGVGGESTVDASGDDAGSPVYMTALG